MVARAGGAALNPCDPGGMAAGAVLLAEAIGRAVVGISSLVELGRRGPVADYEEAALAAGLLLLYDRPARGGAAAGRRGRAVNMVDLGEDASSPVERRLRDHRR